MKPESRRVRRLVASFRRGVSGFEHAAVSQVVAAIDAKDRLGGENRAANRTGRLLAGRWPALFLSHRAYPPPARAGVDLARGEIGPNAS